MQQDIAANTENKQEVRQKPASLITMDNFWNVVTWVAMLIGAYKSFVNGNGWGLLGSFTLLPYLIAKLNNVSCTEDGKVLTKRGRSLSMYFPFEFSMTIYRTIFATIASILLINIFIPSFEICFVILFFFFWLPMSYFIRNNIPVSAFFNAGAWHYNEKIEVEEGNDRISHSSPSSYNKDAPYYSPSHQSNLSNIYHRK